MRYEDFSIRILPGAGDVYTVHVSSPAGEASSTLELPFDLDEVGKVLHGLAQTVRGAEEPTQRDVKVVHSDEPDVGPEIIGKALYAALFRDKVQSLLDSSEGMLRESDRGLRIRLHIDLEGKGLAEVASLPWEFLYREDNRRFLNLSQSTPIIRSLDVLQPPKPLPFNPPLRILVVISNPTGSAALDLDRERELIESSWGRMEGVKVHFVERPTTSALLEKLAEEEFHVLHFMGHGDFNRETGRGVLLLEDDTGGVEQVDASTMEVLLRDESTLRLVFLNACKTAMATEEQSLDPFAGVATSLIMAGIPAVVAMQFPISDAAAVKFAGTFYRRVVQGYPVDAAMAEARKAIRVAEPQSMEWATPVLFMRSRDGVLFESARPGEEVVIDAEPVVADAPSTQAAEPTSVAAAPEHGGERSTTEDTEKLSAAEQTAPITSGLEDSTMSGPPPAEQQRGRRPVIIAAVVLLGVVVAIAGYYYTNSAAVEEQNPAVAAPVAQNLNQATYQSLVATCEQQPTWEWSCEVPAIPNIDPFLDGVCACRGRILLHIETDLLRCEELPQECGGVSFEKTLGYAPEMDWYEDVTPH